MSGRPFRKRLLRRTIRRSNFPADLAEFYSRYEGIGLEASPENMIRLCRLKETEVVSWEDLHVVGEDACPWPSFSAIRIGMGCFFDEIVSILDCPAAPAGSVLAIGPDMTNGPGGRGPALCETSLVLANSFSEWLNHVESLEWNEPGIGSSTIQFEGEAWKRLKDYYGALNPNSTLWGDKAS